MKKKLFIYFIVVLFLYPIEGYANSNMGLNDLHISFELDLMNWNEANLLLPKYSKFTVIDVESGKSFKVQRRAGRDHTDVQPLTSKDTKIMKEIYSGKWSWRRRAILVQTEDYLIPASMHGMPHGAGALQNNFSGHFCIHFLGSTTHKSEEMDYSHKLMTLKAAGRLDDYVNSSSPEELVRLFIEGINQHDQYLLSLTTTKGSGQNLKLKKMIKNIETIKIKELGPITQDIKKELTIEIEAEVTMYTKSDGKAKGQFLLKLSRPSLIDSWKIHREEINLFLIK
jgi:hypothetical protein